MIRSATLAAVAVGFCASSATAALVFTNSLATWNAQVGPASASEDFQGFGSDTSFRTSAVALAGGMSLAQVGTDQSFRNYIDTNPFQFGDNNGTTHASMYVDLEGPTGVNLTLANAADGIGFNLYGHAGGERLVLSFFDVFNNLLFTGMTAGGDGFFGFYATAGEQLGRVEFRGRGNGQFGSGEGFGMDDIVLSYAQAVVPLPSAAGLSALGLTLVAARRRR